MCLELLCNIFFFCAINNRFVWVLPLLLPVTSWSDSSLLLLMSEVDETGSQCKGSGAAQPHRNTDIWILWSWEYLPEKRQGPLSSMVHCRRTRTVNHEFTVIYWVFLLLFTQIKRAICPEVFPQGPPCPFLIAQNCFLNFFIPFKSSLNSPLSFLQFLSLASVPFFPTFSVILSASVLWPAFPIFNDFFTFFFFISGT